MPQADEQQNEKRDTDEAFSEREKAIGNKLWGVYISEAEKYDQGLIDGWRSDMDGLLIFAGLFSGVVTTFIIDSYKTLNPDSGSQTVVLLNQISQQLASMNNSTAVMNALPPAAPFSPPVSALVCNALWFASLGLSLSSALIATLVEQWTREYHHRTSMFSSISIRSRVYMYLYYGLRRFSMHAVVGIPPLLLHTSLVLFFAGLVAFLVPVNAIIMSISSALLGLFVLVYLTFTVLPLFFFDCPYQTPLTRILWPLKQSLGHALRAYLWRAVGVCKTYVLKRVPVTDHEKAVESAGTTPAASDKGSAAEDTLPQSQSMFEAIRSEALRSTVKTETRALAWTVRSLSGDEELEPFVVGLPLVLWDFETSKPHGVYRDHFHSLLRDPKIHLCQRLGDFMAGSNNNLLEDKVRLRRQLSVLRAIWAICAFSLHTDSPLPSPIGEADVDKALLGSKFHASPDVQSMILDVTALIRLNMIEHRSRERAPTQPSSSDAEAEEQRHADMHWTYTDYLLTFSKCAASFQRDAIISLFDRSQMRFTEADGYRTLYWALRELIGSALDKAADEIAENVIFAARLMISPFAQISGYPEWSPLLEGLGPFLVRHPSLAVSDPEFDSKHHYTRFLCYMLCGNLFNSIDPQSCVDALQLIYRELLNPDVSPRDLDTHLLVLCTLRTDAANIRTHHLAAIVQYIVLNSSKRVSSESEQLLNIFDDDYWFRSVLGFDSDEPSAQQIYDCARVGVFTTFLEQCTSRSLDQIEHDLDFNTLKRIQHADMSRSTWTLSRVSSVIPTGLQHRFADAVSGFIRKYLESCLAERDGLYSVIRWAVHKYDGWMTNVDALCVLESALSEVQTDNQQLTHRERAGVIRNWIKKRPLLPENIPAAFVPFVSAEERPDADIPYRVGPE
ncbi:unnamed protein product [Mycena citricolor]|uniref:DUF6535 domain-containing protein n=1 Tax=Mycena citricolor TaxID=2018698 RepID=A0AAD2K4G1_9AGAR|nr:unnamed protein product [Mycena citricolor]